LFGEPAVDFEDQDASDGGPAERDLTEAITVLNALSSAWSTFRLYPNPATQPAFAQALATIRSLESELPITFEIGVAGLTVSGEPLPYQHAGAEQLSRRLYLHSIEALTVEEPPTDREVIDLFGVIALDEDEAQQQGGVSALFEEGSLRIFERRTLDEELEQDGRGEGRGGDGAPERVSQLAALVEGGAEPEQVLDHLMAESGGDVDGISERYVEGFTEIHTLTGATGAPDSSLPDMFLPYMVDDIGASPTGTFVEVFFRLPAEARSKIFTSFVQDAAAGSARMFLDQFSGEELLDLATGLTPSDHEVLLVYARDAAEVDADHAAVLGPLLNSTSEVREARQATADYAARLLEEVDLGIPIQGLADEIRTSLKPDSIDDYGRIVVRGLFATVERADRIKRLARIWAARVRARVMKGDYAGAISEVEAVQRDAAHGSTQKEAIAAALGRIVNAEFVASLAETDDRAQQTKLLQALGTPATSRLIELLAAEEDAAARRSLLDLLAVLCKTNPRPLIAALGDDRWYVVRNVAMILGKTGHSSAVRHLKRQLNHEDERVRVEVLRALMPLAQDDAVDMLVAALADESKRVRYAATSMLKSADGASVDSRLAAVVDQGSASEAVVLSVVEALAGRDTPQAKEALEAIAGRRVSMSRSSRAVRNAARVALGGKS